MFTRPPALEKLCLLSSMATDNNNCSGNCVHKLPYQFTRQLSPYTPKETNSNKEMHGKLFCDVLFIATIGFVAVCVEGFRSVCPVSHFNVSGIGWCLKHGNLYVIPRISVWATKWKLLEFITTAWCFGFVSPLGRNQTEGTRGESHAKDCRLQNADKNMCSLSQAATCHAQSCHWLLIATSTIFRREWLINNKSPPVFPLKSTTDGSGGRYAVVKE